MKATKLEIAVLRQEALLLRGRRKEEEGRSKKKYFSKYEMVPILSLLTNCDRYCRRVGESESLRRKKFSFFLLPSSFFVTLKYGESFGRVNN
ncbi:hypothetical protein Osc7112_1735 [Oscillatoria nigro-viridis PCC 7112]|uniref:Uncharacterized protein n=1 Tax=Phormidium nigroviride PCC 7112 TaxID=179408 RepID=K9VDI6_9CYAN|nr:hypothetical protein Osc7112_1735 [Oscillatoria nigro-viridis PCC 7112]